VSLLDIGLLVLVTVVCVVLILVARGESKQRKYVRWYLLGPERDEQGRRNLPPNAPNMSVAALQAQINEVSISLQEHLKDHHELEMTDEEFERVHLSVLEALRKDLPE
jgi:hypothetical protein